MAYASFPLILRSKNKTEIEVWIFLNKKFKMGKSAKKRHDKNDSKYKRLGISKKLEIIEKLESKETI